MSGPLRRILFTHTVLAGVTNSPSSDPQTSIQLKTNQHLLDLHCLWQLVCFCPEGLWTKFPRIPIATKRTPVRKSDGGFL